MFLLSTISNYNAWEKCFLAWLIDSIHTLPLPYKFFKMFKNSNWFQDTGLRPIPPHNTGIFYQSLPKAR